MVKLLWDIETKKIIATVLRCHYTIPYGEKDFNLNFNFRLEFHSTFANSISWSNDGFLSYPRLQRSGIKEKKRGKEGKREAGRRKKEKKWEERGSEEEKEGEKVAVFMFIAPFAFSEKVRTSTSTLIRSSLHAGIALKLTNSPFQ